MHPSRPRLRPRPRAPRVRRCTLLPVHFVAGLLVLAAPAAGQLAEGAQALRERARAAAGSWPSTAAVLAGTGRSHASGTEGKLALWLAADGRFRTRLDSALPEEVGFDGEHAWSRDRTGLARRIELEEADRQRLFHLVLAGRWASASEVEVRTVEGEASSLVLHLVGTPLEMTLRLDPASFLPATLEEQGDGGLRHWSFGEHRAVDGRVLPHRWSFLDGATEDTFAVESYRALAPAEPEAEQAFRVELAPARDVRFAPDVPAEIAVARAPSGHLLVEPRLEGESVGAFVLDTGAGITVIDRSVAEELFLEPLGSTLAVGVAGAVRSDFRRGELFQLGPVTIAGPIYGDLDLGFLQRAMGRRIAGIVGYDLLARCVVVIDPSGPRVSLHDPARFELSQGRWQDLVLHQNHPCVVARFEGEREGLFRLDTGAGNRLTFHAPAVRALGLLEGRALESGHSGGVGGTASAPEGTLAWFELAGKRFENARVSFSEARAGAFTDAYTLGNIGQGFLRAYRLVLDYPNGRIALVPLEDGR